MRNVLLAVDGSSASMEAVQFLADFPSKGPFRVTVLSIVHFPRVYGSYANVEMMETSFERDREAALAVCEKVQKRLAGTNAVVTHEIGDGSVGESIVQRAKTLGCDLIVLGAKGHSQVSRILLGSTSDHVATHASCSVVVVRANPETPMGSHRKVCLAIDGTSASQTALDQVCDVPWESIDELHGIAVVTYMNDLLGQPDRDPRLVDQAETDLAAVKVQLGHAGHEVVTKVIEQAHVGEAIVDYVQQHHADMLVVGEAPRSGLQRFLLGSTSRFVLRHAPCSVWIARKPS